jgi:Arc/MetJ-type ribon-helix-helix transcriptional regulator
MTISVAKDVEEFLQAQVRAGISPDANQLVNDLIRSAREQREQSFEVTPELEAWLLEAADKPASPLDSSDFEAIRQRVRARLKSSA